MVNLVSHSLDGVFHALRDPVRRDLMERLRLGETAIAVLAEAYAVSLPAISRHVKILERAGLVSRRKVGREFLLRLRVDRLRDASRWLDALAGAPSDPQTLVSSTRAGAPEHLPVRLGDTYRVALSRRRLN